MEKLGRLAISDEGFVFDPATGDSYLMNRTGTVILRGLQQGHDEAAVAAAIVEDFDVEPDTAARDVADFVNRLEHLRLSEGPP